MTRAVSGVNTDRFARHCRLFADFGRQNADLEDRWQNLEADSR